MKRLIVVAFQCTVLFVPAALLAKDKPIPAKTSPATAKAAPAAAVKAEPAAARAPTPAAQVVEISVTKAGFVPAEIKVKAGQPVKLMVTRTIDKTCAKDIVIKDYDVKQPLPLNQTVEVVFTPTKPGITRFACAMDMIAGRIVAE
jgi:plastocyanin domain-containing protein